MYFTSYKLDDQKQDVATAENDKDNNRKWKEDDGTACF